MRGRWIAWMIACGAGAHADFTLDERAQVMRYWSEPGRYVPTVPPNALEVGPWQARLTPEGSLWLWNFNRLSSRNPDWEKWVDQKVKADRAGAEGTAARLNALVLRRDPPPERREEPGSPIPSGLAQAAGNPPTFAAAVTPMRHEVRFDDGLEVIYHDYVPMKAKYPYFRFGQGVMFGGQSVRNVDPAELASMMEEAGIDALASNVFRAVSLLEGGFDSVNTYDTGFVSIGFIQFACQSGGSGSLGSVLLMMKINARGAFESDFRRFGIDVTDSAVLQTVDPSTGAELLGPDAAMKIIQDKRLVAVFQRAGAVSRAFRVAQLQVAKNQYYPADDAISLVVNGTPIFGRVADFVKSEAGLATLMDRKVNTGSLGPLISVATRIAGQAKITRLADLAAHEREIIAAMRYRRDFLADASLTQPFSDRKG